MRQCFGIIKTVMNTEQRIPLAERMRATNFEEFVGQEHIVGKNKLL